jgi:hypothetical protein
LLFFFFFFFFFFCGPRGVRERKKKDAMLNNDCLSLTQKINGLTLASFLSLSKVTNQPLIYLLSRTHA